MNKVKLYSLSTCPWCKKIKQLLSDQNVTYELCEVDQTRGDEQKQMLSEVDKLSPKRSFPITVISGTVILGYKPEQIKEALQK